MIVKFFLSNSQWNKYSLQYLKSIRSHDELTPHNLISFEFAAYTLILLKRLNTSCCFSEVCLPGNRGPRLLSDCREIPDYSSPVQLQISGASAYYAEIFSPWPRRSLIRYILCCRKTQNTKPSSYQVSVCNMNVSVKKPVREKVSIKVIVRFF